MNGVVIRTTGKRYTVKSNNGEILQCRLKGKFRIKGIKSTNPIVVGDKVEVEHKSEFWMIVKLQERKNYILRKSVNLSKQTHIIASNIDQAILMVTIQNPITSTGFIDRFLAAAQSYGIEVLIIFNKLDIYDKQMMQKQKQLRQMYEQIGYDCIALSVLHDDLTKVITSMKNKVNVIAGHSGVGKSTLIIIKGGRSGISNVRAPPNSLPTLGIAGRPRRASAYSQTFGWATSADSLPTTFATS